VAPFGGSISLVGEEGDKGEEGEAGRIGQDFYDFVGDAFWAGGVASA
jgi:hypothetical protein